MRPCAHSKEASPGFWTPIFVVGYEGWSVYLPRHTVICSKIMGFAFSLISWVTIVTESPCHSNYFCGLASICQGFLNENGAFCGVYRVELG